ncbi:MAG: hypothetical protein QG657_3470 [Acidobacteriota bacterium]|nr:hypothetical protein [Acidobacteriota bacterium]
MEIARSFTVKAVEDDLLLPLLAILCLVEYTKRKYISAA